jgi:hypothetical protein
VVLLRRLILPLSCESPLLQNVQPSEFVPPKANSAEPIRRAVGVSQRLCDNPDGAAIYAPSDIAATACWK